MMSGVGRSGAIAAAAAAAVDRKHHAAERVVAAWSMPGL